MKYAGALCSSDITAVTMFMLTWLEQTACAEEEAGQHQLVLADVHILGLSVGIVT